MKVLFCGLGSIGIRHAKILEKLYPEIELYALKSNPMSESVQDLGINVKSIYTMGEVFKLKPDLAFITNPTNLHIKTANSLAEIGCSLFIEKPLSNSLDGIDKLKFMVEKKHVITLMGCNMRFHPAIVKLKEIISENVYGKVLNFSVDCGSYLPDWRPNQDYTKSYSASINRGGGVVFDLIHEIDYSKFLFGDFKNIKAFSGKASSLKIDSSDFANMIIKTENGINGIIHLDYYRHYPKREIEVIFEKIIVCVDLIGNQLIIKEHDKETRFTYNVYRDYTYEKQIKYLMNCIENKIFADNDLQEGITVLKYALKILEDRNNEGSVL